MYTAIENMPNYSRVWIYQANREWTEPEGHIMAETLKDFCAQWAAHGSGLKTSFRLDHGRFVLLAVDEKAGDASGCSIDSSVRVLKELEQKLDVDFFDRSEIAFWEEGKVVTHEMTKLRKLFAMGRLQPESETFNTLASTLGEWNERPRMMVADCWLKRYLPQVSV